MGMRVVVSGLFAVAGCGGGKAPPEPLPSPPEPAPGAEAAPPDAPVTPRPAEPAHPPKITNPPGPPLELPEPAAPDPPGPRRLNPQHEGRAVHVRPDGACFVFLPMPPAPEGPTPSFRPPPTEAVPCPPAMTDPSWLACAYGVVDRMPDQTCVCHVLGNPPPPPRLLERCPPVPL